MKNKIVVTIALLLFTFTGYSQAGKVLSVVKLDASNSSYFNNFKDYVYIGSAIENIGDIDGDGINELAVGAANSKTLHGLVLILFLNRDGSIRKHTTIGKDQGGLDSDYGNLTEFGTSISNLKDLDGDGINDIVVGDGRGGNGGEIYILFLNSNGTVKSHKRIYSNVNGFNVSIENNNRFGRSVSYLGDLNGDGVSDIGVGDVLDDDGGSLSGCIYILFLNKNGTVIKHQKISRLEGNFPGNIYTSRYFGGAITHLDSNKIAIGYGADSCNNKECGSAWILNLDTNGMVVRGNRITDGESNFNEPLIYESAFGVSVSEVGDINGDSTIDMCVGAISFQDTGAVFCLLMNQDGTVKEKIAYHNKSGKLNYKIGFSERYGADICGLGDLNGDGKLDIVVSLRDLDDPGLSLNRGGIHIYFLDGKDHGNGIGVSDIEKKNISLFPNPASNTFKLELGKTQSGGKVTITDVSGKVLWNTNAYNGEDIPVSKLSSGLYHVNLVVNNEVFYNKLIVQ